MKNLVRRSDRTKSVVQGEIKYSPKVSGDDESLVKRSGSYQAMAGLAGVVKDRSVPEYNSYTLSYILQQPQIQEKLSHSNLFIFGLLGFYDLISKAISMMYTNLSDEPVKIYRTGARLRISPTEDNRAGPDTAPIILIPTVESQSELNRIVAKALKTKHPIWLVALPSLVEKQLLVSFNGFFVCPGSSRELSLVSELTPIKKEDIDRLNKGEIKSIFTLDMYIPQISLKDRFGTVTYLCEIDNFHPTH